MNVVVDWCKEKWAALKICKIAIHVIIMGFMLYTFTEVVEYPVTFAEANNISQTSDGVCYNGHPPANATISPNTGYNFCGGTLTNLIAVSMLDNAGYTIGVVIYFAFLLKMKPSTFYSLAFPWVSGFLFVLVISLWFVGYMSGYVVLVLIAVGNVVPYYLEQYNFYFWTAIIDAKHFGFFYAIYDLGHSFLHMGSALFLQLMPQNLSSSSPTFSALLALDLLMVLCTYVYSLWFSHAYKNELTKINLGGEEPSETSSNDHHHAAESSSSTP